MTVPAGGGGGTAPPVEVAHVLWRLSQGGGVQTVVRMLIGAIDPADARFTVVTARPRLAADGLETLPVTLEALGHEGDRLGLHHRIGLMVRAARVLRQCRPDVVQLHSGTVWMGFLAPVAAPRAGRLVEVHDAPGSGRHGRLTDRVEGWWARWSRATVVCHSTSVAAAVAERWRIAPGRLHTVALAVDVDRFAPRPGVAPATRADLGVPADAVVLVVVGRLVPSKRFDLAVGALARLPSSVVLVVVGDGPQRPRLAALAADLGVVDRVVFAGPRYGDDLADLVRAADVLVSTSSYEGFGLTLVEGMAAGLPVVAASVGGVTDIVVAGVTGLLVPVDDVDALAEALGALVADPDRRRELGRAGRARAEAHYTPSRLAEAFTALYRSANHTRPGRP